MPAEERSNEVSSTKDVKGTRNDGASDAVRDGKVPSNLWSVDGEMGGNGAAEALGFEDGWGCRSCIGGSWRLLSCGSG